MENLIGVLLFAFVAPIFIAAVIAAFATGIGCVFWAAVALEWLYVKLRQMYRNWLARIKRARRAKA